jgi:hypothetical protein
MDKPIKNTLTLSATPSCVINQPSAKRRFKQPARLVNCIYTALHIRQLYLTLIVVIPKRKVVQNRNYVKQKLPLTIANFSLTVTPNSRTFPLYSSIRQRIYLTLSSLVPQYVAFFTELLPFTEVKNSDFSFFNNIVLKFNKTDSVRIM